MSGPRPRLLLVVPRPPQRDGQGYQRRAHDVRAALQAEWDVECLSWLPEGKRPGLAQYLVHPGRLARAVALAVTAPAQVAYFQAFAGNTLSRLPPHDLALFFTDRTVPRSRCGPFAIDFIDDFGGAAFARAERSGILRRALWRHEGRRLRRLDDRLAEEAVFSVAITEVDAAGIAPSTKAIPMAMQYRPMPDNGTKVVFGGNLFFAPNTEAAAWICSTLVPRLQSLGVEPGRVLIAGRRPPRSLCRQAEAAGVDLRPDPPDMATVLAEAAVAVSPVVFGSGCQNKVIDATSAGRACVVTPFTNRPLGLVDGVSAAIRERAAADFATAVVTLLADPALRARLVAAATERLAAHAEEAVHHAWRAALRAARCETDGRSGGLRHEEQVDDAARK